ncbi:MAG: PQQ-dependent sugar dehydrogenase [Anaerolineae bacterium]|jgi:hypothetical protein|nr:PQQ-dependent sugar dehydrogenase [Anaerolineae bacterium]
MILTRPPGPLWLVLALLLAGCAAAPAAVRPAAAGWRDVVVQQPAPTLLPTAAPTQTPPPTPTLAGTPPLHTLTPAARPGIAPAQIEPAAFSAAAGWSCGDFPCAEDIAGFLQRLRVPAGFAVEFVGRFPGQVQQITYGSDGLLYATVLESGTQTGAVYVLPPAGPPRRYSSTLVAPLGLAFQPGTAILYVSARSTPLQGGTLWRILPDGTQHIVTDALPCCYLPVDNQPAGMVFGPDGYLYLGVGSLTDYTAAPDPQARAYIDPLPGEAAILRVQPHTGEIGVYASGIRYPFDLTFDSSGQFYATDSGLVSGPGDRLLTVFAGGFYGWPYYRFRGCPSCPPSRAGGEPLPDLLALPDYTLPRGIAACVGCAFPDNMQDTLFVALWNGTPWAQRILWVEPRRVTPEYVPVAFLTGLIRPVDVTFDPAGALVVADYVYGHIWRVRYTGAGVTTAPPLPSPTSILSLLTPAGPAAPTAAPGLFVTNTPQG